MTPTGARSTGSSTRADALAGAWGARARASTTIGQERAILRLFGVTGLDARGAAAGRRHGRSLAGGRPARRSAAASPCRSRWRCSSTTSSRSSSPSTSRPGAIDLALESRAAARARPARRGRGGGRRASPRAADRADRRPADGPARDDRRCSARPRGRGSGVTLREPDVETPSTRRSSLIAAGIDLIRVEVPIGRELADRMADAGLSVPEWQPRERDERAGRRELDRAGPDRQPAGARPPARRAPTGPPRERRAYVRLATVSAGPRGAGGRRRRRLRADRRRRASDPMAEIVGGVGRAGSVAVRPRLRPPARPAGRHGHPRRARTAGRRAGPVGRDPVRPGHARRPGPRAPAAGRDAGPRRRPARRPDHRRARCRPG